MNFTPITNSLSWPKTELEILNAISSITDIRDKRQCHKIIENIGLMVSELSKRELYARRRPGNPQQSVIAQRDKINAEIGDFEKLLFFRLLCK